MDARGQIDFVRVLGPIQVVRLEGPPVDPGSTTQRRLLAMLALASPRSVRADRLADGLGLTPSALRTSVSRLRRTVGGALSTTAAGYVLDVPVDAALLCDRLHRAGGDPDAIASVLERWTGPALEEFASEPWAAAEATRLEEIRINAVEDRCDALIARARHEQAVAVLEGHVLDHPLRDRAWQLLMRALAASGRQADALRAYQRYRRLLNDETGTEPSPATRDVDRRIAEGWGGTDDSTESTVRREHASPPPPPGPPDGPILAGRASYLALLAGALDEARSAGALRVVIVEGEEGIGKTSLLAGFARANRSEAVIVYGRCDETGGVPLEPFRTITGVLVDVLPPDVLRSHVEAHGGVLVRLAPRLATRVQARQPLSMDDATARFVLFEAVADLVRRGARTAPLVLLVDDLHWADTTTIQLVRRLARTVVSSPVLLVVTVRPVGAAPSAELRATVADLAHGSSSHIELRGLDADDIDELARSVLGSAESGLDRELAERLGRETAGNPLFVTQLLRHWATDGRAAASHVDGRSFEPAAVPATVRDIVMQRVDRLGVEVRTVLAAAAVLGVEFTERLLPDMVDLPDPEIDAAIDSATRAGLLEQPSPGLVRFVHGLVASVMATEIGGPERRRLHERAAHALLKDEDLLGPANPAQLAHHFEHAALPTDAMRWSVSAGDDAVDHHSPAEGVTWYQRALGYAEHLGRPDDERADLVVRLGHAQVRMGSSDGLKTLVEGAGLARSCGAAATVVRAAFATDAGFARMGEFAPDQLRIVEWALESDGLDPSDRARLLALLGQSLVHTNQGDRRVAAAHEALDLARSIGDPTVLAAIAPAALFALWLPGSAVMRMDLAAEAIDAAERSGDPYLAFMVHTAAYNAAISSADAAAAARSDFRRRELVNVAGDRGRWSVGMTDGFAHTMAARFEDAERAINETFRIGDHIGEAVAFEVFAGQLFTLRTFQGRHAELVPLMEQTLRGGAARLPFRLGYGVVCAATDRGDIALGILDEGRSTGFADVPRDFIWMTSIIGYAVIATELADADAARRLYPLIAPYENEVAFSGTQSQGPVAAYLGKLATLIGDHDAAEAHLRRALATTEAFGWTYHRATTLYALAASAFARDGRLDARSRAELDEAEGLFREHDIAIWRDRAASLRATVPG